MPLEPLWLRGGVGGEPAAQDQHPTGPRPSQTLGSVAGMASTQGFFLLGTSNWAADRSGDKALPTFQEKLVCLGCVEISKRSGRALRITPPDTGVRVRSPGDRESRGG